MFIFFIFFHTIRLFVCFLSPNESCKNKQKRSAIVIVKINGVSHFNQKYSEMAWSLCFWPHELDDAGCFVQCGKVKGGVKNDSKWVWHTDPSVVSVTKCDEVSVVQQCK